MQRRQRTNVTPVPLSTNRIVLRKRIACHTWNRRIISVAISVTVNFQTIKTPIHIRHLTNIRSYSIASKFLCSFIFHYLNLLKLNASITSWFMHHLKVLCKQFGQMGIEIKKRVVI